MSLLTGLTSEYKVRKKDNVYVTLRNDARMHINGVIFVLTVCWHHRFKWMASFELQDISG